MDVSKLSFNDFLTLYGPVLNAGFGGDRSKVEEMLKRARGIYDLYNDGPKKEVESGNDLFSEEMMLSRVEQLRVPRGIVYSDVVKATVGNF